MLWLFGCGFINPPGDPVIEAHRLGGGYWPQNSATALENAVAEGFAGLEFDLVVTGDGVPVLSHDPWLDETCTTLDGEPLPERVYLNTLTIDEVLDTYLCGGLRDLEFPDVEPVATPVVTYEALLRTVAPETLLHHDVKYQDGMTVDPQTTAQAIFDTWSAYNQGNPAFFDVGEPAIILALEAADPAIDTRLAVPNFAFDGSTVGTALGHEFGQALGFADVLQMVDALGADGIAVAMQVADRSAIEELNQLGYRTNLWTPNTPAELRTFCAWPVESISSDDPRIAPCL